MTEHDFTPVVPGYELSEPINLGGGVTIQLVRSDGVIDGLYWDHGCVWGNTPILFDVPSNAHVPPEGKWQLESLEPLHLSPSLLCPCGWHGFIRQGKWEAC